MDDKGELLPREFFLQPAEGEHPDLRTALRRARSRRTAKDPDYVKKQLDGVIPPAPMAMLSPEHYHISYEYGNLTYPNTQVTFSTSRWAYMQIWRMAALSVWEPKFWEDAQGNAQPFVDIYTPLKGRTGIHEIRLRVVECFLKGCARAETILQPLLAGLHEVPDYVTPPIKAVPSRPSRRKGGIIIPPGVKI